jgi:hypothetical protein
MPDITMCLNRQCPKRRKCYRKTAKPNEPYQSFSDFKYGVDENGFFFCASYWPVTGEK